jgi:hypothetical protein
VASGSSSPLASAHETNATGAPSESYHRCWPQTSLHVGVPAAGVERESLLGSVSKVEVTTLIALICKVLFPSISTFETLPSEPGYYATCNVQLSYVRLRNRAS